MQWYQLALVAGAFATMATSWHVPRSAFWIACGAVSFVVSSVWHNAGLPYGAAVGAATNALVCMLIYTFARRKWELRVWNCFHLMILLEVLMLAGFIKSHFVFAVSLELVNWLALLVIATTGIFARNEGWNGVNSSAVFRSVFSVIDNALRSPRPDDQFWKG